MVGLHEVVLYKGEESERKEVGDVRQERTQEIYMKRRFEALGPKYRQKLEIGDCHPPGQSSLHFKGSTVVVP
jgi:hypothetical protein